MSDFWNCVLPCIRFSLQTRPWNHRQINVYVFLAASGFASSNRFISILICAISVALQIFESIIRSWYARPQLVNVMTHCWYFFDVMGLFQELFWVCLMNTLINCFAARTIIIIIVPRTFEIRQLFLLIWNLQNFIKILFFATRFHWLIIILQLSRIARDTKCFTMCLPQLPIEIFMNRFTKTIVFALCSVLVLMYFRIEHSFEWGSILQLFRVTTFWSYIKYVLGLRSVIL